MSEKEDVGSAPFHLRTCWGSHGTLPVDSLWQTAMRQGSWTLQEIRRHKLTGLGRTMWSCRIWELWWRWQLRRDVWDCQALAWVEPCEAARFENRDECGSWDEKWCLRQVGEVHDRQALAWVELWGCTAWELRGRWPLGWKVMQFNGQWWKVSGRPRFYVSGSFSCILTATKGLSSSCNKLPQGTVNRAFSFRLMVTRMMIKNSVCVCGCVHAHAWVLCMKYVIVNLQGTVHFMIILDWCFVWTPIDVASIECSMTGHFHH